MTCERVRTSLFNVVTKHKSRREAYAELVFKVEGPQEVRPRRHMAKALKMKVEDERHLRCDRCAVETNIEKVPTAFPYPPSTHRPREKKTVMAKKVVIRIHIESGNDSCSPNAIARLTRRAPSLLSTSPQVSYSSFITHTLISNSCPSSSASCISRLCVIAINPLVHLFQKAQCLRKRSRRLFSYCQLLVRLFRLIPLVQLRCLGPCIVRRGAGSLTRRFVAFPMRIMSN